MFEKILFSFDGLHSEFDVLVRHISATTGKTESYVRRMISKMNCGQAAEYRSLEELEDYRRQLLRERVSFYHL